MSGDDKTSGGNGHGGVSYHGAGGNASGGAGGSYGGGASGPVGTFRVAVGGGSSVEHNQRRYNLSLAQLVDALTIVQMKQIFIPEHAADYAAEVRDILHDINLLLQSAPKRFDAEALHAVVMIALTNREIWLNESAIRSGAVSGENVEKRLRFTHSINGVRNTAKNWLTARMGGRMDYKIDCLAADLLEEFGNWNVFGEGEKS